MKIIGRNKIGQKKTVLMTEGNVWIQILFFSLPLLLGNLFQQLYNTVDSVVVGNFIGNDALAAVNSTNSLINLIVALFSGIATGAGVLIAQYFGAKDDKKTEWAVHTAIILSLIGGVILTFVGVSYSQQILVWMGTPESVMPSSVLYLRIYFFGSLANLTYNMSAGILRAVGDSKNPLYYLIVASITNIVLDIVFVVVFHRGVDGVALATIISQFISCILALGKLIACKNESYGIKLRNLKLHKHMMERIIKLGIPSGLQGCIVSFSNVVVQSNINSFGEIAMAGCGSYSKVDGFVLLPVFSFSMAIMTFVGQNVGAKKYDRVKKGIFVTVVITTIYVAIASVFLLIFGRNIISIFSKDSDIIHYGYRMLQILMPFYFAIGLSNILTGAFRGAGRTVSSMLIMVINLCVIRVIWVNLMVPIHNQIETVMWAYPISWVTAFLCSVWYLYFGKWLKNDAIEETLNE